jgi:apolipoprotein D and lipocalin family protein
MKHFNSMRMQTWFLPLILVLGGVLIASSSARAELPPLQPIQSLNLPRYMGTWYEVAKFPNRFQSHCQSDTQANYRVLPEGGVEVINRCRKADGVLDQAVGLARRVGPQDSATLTVRFAPEWLSFLPMVWGNYWVIDLDDDYTLAAVSEPKREYLWVLSRTPQVDAKRWNALMHRLEALGLSIGKLERTPQRSAQP